MKKYLLSSVAAGAVALAGGAAAAADVIPVVQAPVAVAPPVVEEDFNWGGFYLGTVGGITGGQFDLEFTAPVIPPTPPPPPTIFSITATGFSAGATAGFNFQTNNLVFGLETDLNWTTHQARFAVSQQQIILQSLEEVVRVHYYGTLRGRVGLATGHEGRFLPYFTGGLAYGATSLSGTFGVVPTVLTFNSGKIKSLGWTVGGGVEYAFSDRISFKTKYLFINLGETETAAPFVVGPIPAPGGNVTYDTRIHTIRAGFNFQL